MEGGNMRLEYRQGSRKILNSANSIVEINWNWKILIKKKKKFILYSDKFSCYMSHTKVHII